MVQTRAQSKAVVLVVDRRILDRHGVGRDVEAVSVVAEAVLVAVSVVNEDVAEDGGATGRADRDGVRGRVLDDEVVEGAVASELDERMGLGNTYRDPS